MTRHPRRRASLAHGLGLAVVAGLLVAPGLSTDGRETADLPADAALAAAAVAGPETALSSTAAGAAVGETAAAFSPAVRRHLVVWTQLRTVGDGVKQEILGRYLNGRTGAPDGAAFLVARQGEEQDASLDASDPAVAWDAAGSRFLVSWTGDTLADTGAVDASATEVFVRAVAPAGPGSTGPQLGAPVQVSETGPTDDPAYDAQHSDLDALPGGGAVVVWDGSETDQPTRTGIRLRRLTSALAPATDVRTVDGATTATPTHRDPAVATDVSGRALVGWQAGSGAGEWEVRVASDLASGSGTVSPVTDQTVPGGTSLDVASDGNRWAVVWEGLGTGGRSAVVGAEVSLDQDDPIPGPGQVLRRRDDADLLTPRAAFDRRTGQLLLTDVARAAAGHSITLSRYDLAGTVATPTPVEATTVGTTRAAQPSPPALSWSSAALGSTVVAWGGAIPGASGSAAYSSLVSGTPVVTADLRTTAAVAPTTASAPVPGGDPGDALTYTVGFGSAAGSPDVVDDAVLTVQAPPGVVLDPAAATLVAPPGATLTQTGTSPLRYTVSELTPGSSGTVTLPGRVKTGTPDGPQVLTAEVDAPNLADATPQDRTSTAVVTVDARPGVVSVVPRTTSPTRGPAVFRVTFTEPVTGFTADDVVVIGTGNASLATTTVAGVAPATGSAYAAFDVTLGGLTGTGTLALSLTGNATVTDLGGRPLAPGLRSRSNAVVVDTTPPVLSVSSGAPQTVRGAFEVTVVFSEPVTGFTAADVQVANGAVTAFTARSGTEYVVTVAPSADGPVSVTVPPGAATDAAGNPSGGSAAGLTRTADLTGPGVELSAPAGPLNGTFFVLVDFTEPVTGLTIDDFDVSQGEVTGLSGSGARYVVRVTPAAEGPLALTLRAAAAADEAGNPSAGPVTLTRTVDRVAPTVVLTAPEGPRSGPFDLGLEFSEPVAGLSVEDLSVDGATISTLTGSGSTYTARVVPTGDGQVRVTLPADRVADAAGNGNAASTPLTRTVDQTAPTVALRLDETPTNRPFTVDVTFSEPVTGFDEADVTADNATVGAVTGSGTTYQVRIAPTDDGEVVVSVPGAAAVDAAGNPSTAATPVRRTFDATDPAVTLDAPAGPFAGAFDVRVTFSEDVSGFGLDDLVVEGGSASDLREDGASRLVRITAGADGPVSVSVPAGAGTDAAGNASSATADPLVRQVDTTAPTVTLSAPEGPRSGPFEVTITFSEDISGFTRDDVVVDNGAVTSLDGSGRTYTARIEPQRDGQLAITVPTGAAVDAAGNPSGEVGLTRRVDASRPEPTLTTTTSSPTAADRASVTVRFSEPVTGLTADDFEVSGGGSISELTGSGAEYGFVLDLGPGSTTVSLPAAAALDEAGNASVASAPLTLTRDSSVPTVTLESTTAPVTATSPILVTLRFSEPVTGLEVGDLEVAGATVTALTGTGSTYLVELTPTADGIVRLQVPARVALDAAGNGNLPSAPLERRYDATGPRLDVVATPGQTEPVRAPVVSFEVTSDEPVTDLRAEDVTVTGDTGAGLVEVRRSGPGGFTVEVRGMRTTGEVGIDVSAGAVRDEVGNVSSAVSSDLVEWARTDPDPDPDPEPQPGPASIRALLAAPNNGPRADVLTVRTTAVGAYPAGQAAGAFTKLVKVTGRGEDRRRRTVASGRLDADGAIRFVRPDRNGRNQTKYFAVVNPQRGINFGARTNTRNVR